jgi:DNA-binding NarL/FixJ family response regulator
MKAMKVLIADKHPLVCEGLFALLKTYHQVEVVGKATSGQEIIDMVKEVDPDIVVMDIYMPDIDITEIIRTIRKHNDDIKVLLISEYEDRECILRGVKVGGNGYLPKGATALELVSAIQAIQEGGYFLYPSAAKKIVEEYIRIGKTPSVDSLDGLSSREIEVLRLIADGYRNKQIAENLRISLKTVQAHRTSLMSKLDIHNYVDLVKYAIQKHLVEARR